jgi:hypothetical protein
MVSQKRKKSHKTPKWDPSKYRTNLPNKCFLDSVGRKYPVCNAKGVVTLQGLKAARSRAIIVARNKKVNSVSRKKAVMVAKKASKKLNSIKKKKSLTRRKSPKRNAKSRRKSPKRNAKSRRKKSNYQKKSRVKGGGIYTSKSPKFTLKGSGVSKTRRKKSGGISADRMKKYKELQEEVLILEELKKLLDEQEDSIDALVTDLEKTNIGPLKRPGIFGRKNTFDMSKMIQDLPR